MKEAKILRNSFILALLSFLLLFPSFTVRGQSPQTITATGTSLGSDSSIASLIMTFPPAGGPVNGTIQLDEKGVNCSGFLSLTLVGTFAGGDGGLATGTMNGTQPKDCFAGPVIGPVLVEYSGTWTMNFYANGTGSGVMDVSAHSQTKSAQFQSPLKVTFSPAEFQAALIIPSATTAPTPTVTPTESNLVSCVPQVGGLNPAKPGDVISPSATFLDPAGKPVDIIQNRWYFNGQENSSIVWDGTKIMVELQWTCQDNKGYSQSFVIAPYQSPAQPSSEPPITLQIPSSDDITSGVGKFLIGLGGVIGLGGAIGLGAAIIQTIHAGAISSTTITSPAPAIPPPPIPGGPSSQTPGKLDPSLKQHWEVKIKDFIDQRTKIQEKILATNQQIEKLTRLYKNNILKVIMKGGLETGQIIFDAATGGTGEAPKIAVEISKKFVSDKATDAIYQKHDTSQDGKNVVDLKEAIDKLKSQRDQLRGQVKSINHEIEGIKQHIQANF